MSTGKERRALLVCMAIPKRKHPFLELPRRLLAPCRCWALDSEHHRYAIARPDKLGTDPTMLLLLLLFLTFSVLVANPKKLLYTVANPARGLLNREKRTKEKVWQHTPPPTPHTARSEKINKITRRIYRRYAGGRSRVRTRIPSARRLGLWVWLRNSTLPSAIIRFPVSLLLSSPGDV